MNKSLILAAYIAALMISSCSTPVKLMNTATHKDVSVNPVAGLFADIQVNDEKITYFMLPPKSVVVGGKDNVISTAIREALDANGGGDLLVCMETQLKYNDKGEIESVTITGYPAKYVNFRSPGDDYLKTLPVTEFEDMSTALSGVGDPFGKKR